MIDLIKNIEQWAIERNLIEGSTPQKQMLKLMEEFGELCGGIAKNNLNTIKDSIGDCFVVMVILSNQIIFDEEPDFNFMERVDHEIKNGVYDDQQVDSFILDCMHNIGSISLPVMLNWKVKSGFLELLNANLVVISAKFNLDFIDCVQHAYNQIKDRKGKMIDGVFVKEEDL